MAGKGLSEGKLTVPNGSRSSIDSSKLKDEARELNAETLSTQREEKPREEESDGLGGEVSMEHGSTSLFYCQGLLFNEYHSNEAAEVGWIEGVGGG